MLYQYRFTNAYDIENSKDFEYILSRTGQIIKYANCPIV